MNKINILKPLTAGLLALIFAGNAYANLITNGSFEFGTNPPTGGHIQLTAGNTSITGWSITGGSIDWINTTWTASDGTKSLDMNGTSAGTIVSDAFDTIIGTQYNITFDMAGNWFGGSDTKHLNLLVDGNTAQFTVTQPTSFSSADIGWQQMSYSFFASTTSTQLQFSGVYNDGYAWGAALDNVVVTKAAVPEPTSIALLSLGLSAFGFSRKRKKAQ